MESKSKRSKEHLTSFEAEFMNGKLFLEGLRRWLKKEKGCEEKFESSLSTFRLPCGFFVYNHNNNSKTKVPIAFDNFNQARMSKA